MPTVSDMVRKSAVLNVLLGMAIFFFMLAFVPIAGRTGVQVFLGLSAFFFAVWSALSENEDIKLVLLFIFFMAFLYALQVYLLPDPQGRRDFVHPALNIIGVTLITKWRKRESKVGQMVGTKPVKAKVYETLPDEVKRKVILLNIAFILSVSGALFAIYHNRKENMIFLVTLAILLLSWSSELKYKFYPGDDDLITYLFFALGGVIGVLYLIFSANFVYLLIPVALLIACFFGLRRSY